MENRGVKNRCVENRGVEKRCVENRGIENRCVEKSRVHISWQAQYLVKLECHFSWQAQHFVKFWEIAGAPNVVLFHTKCVSKTRKVSEVHFFDLVLPQLMPVQAAWAGEEKTLWSCHHIRYLHTLEDVCRTPRVKISYFFTSHDHIHHVRIQWEGNPLLLFSDPKMVDAHRTEKFRDQASHVTHQQHLQMGLRKGMAILIY